jgi:hypothetical protein
MELVEENAMMIEIDVSGLGEVDEGGLLPGSREQVKCFVKPQDVELLLDGGPDKQQTEIGELVRSDGISNVVGEHQALDLRVRELMTSRVEELCFSQDPEHVAHWYTEGGGTNMSQKIFHETSDLDVEGCLGQSVEAYDHVKLAEVLQEENGVLDSSVVESIVPAREKFQSQVPVKKRDKQKQWGTILVERQRRGQDKGVSIMQKVVELKKERS